VRSFAIGREHALVKAGVVDGLSDAAKRPHAALFALAPVEELPYRILDKLIPVAIPADGHFPIDSLLKSWG
jgi:hypothetical protein